MKYCPECGKALPSETSNFCDNCGTKLGQTPSQVSSPAVTPPIQPGPNPSISEEKNPFVAALCSFFIPGLGQVYDGLTARGIAIYIGTLVGFFIFFIPGLLVWLFGVFDAYSTAYKMNTKQIPFIPTKTAHMILFFILAAAIMVIVVFIVTMYVLTSVFSRMMPH